MPGIEAVDTLAGAFIAGLVTSVHCAGMCGPLACAWCVSGDRCGARERLAPALYQGGRVLSYTALGLLAGALGYLPLTKLAGSPVALLPWLLVLLLLIVGLGLDKKVRTPVAMQRVLARLRAKFGPVGGARNGFMLGIATPLLPCMPLYLMLGVALGSGSALHGGQMMMAFAMGTIPLLWLAQSGLRVWGARLGSKPLILLQRSSALAAAAVIAWRLRGTLGFAAGAAGCGCH